MSFNLEHSRNVDEQYKLTKSGYYDAIDLPKTTPLHKLLVTFLQASLKRRELDRFYKFFTLHYVTITTEMESLKGKTKN